MHDQTIKQIETLLTILKALPEETDPRDLRAVEILALVRKLVDQLIPQRTNP